MSILKKIRRYMDNDPRLKPYLLIWLRKTTKTINEWPQEKFINGVMDCYERRMGYRFDINYPVLFNEKLQWYKVFYQRDDFGYITDKVTFKEYIKHKLGEEYTIPMYGWWDNIKDLERDWDKLPEKFVLKSNLAANSSGVIIIENKSSLDFSEMKKKIKPWLKKRNTLLNSWDCHFYNSTPKILAEEFMMDESGELRDYKFFCFNGKTPYFRVDYGRKNQHCATWFNENKVEQGISVLTFPKDESIKIELPKNIDRMFELAKELSLGFPFVRVDFFSCNGRLYLSELTFAPGGGCSPYPEWFNKILGDMFVLPIDNQHFILGGVK